MADKRYRQLMQEALDEQLETQEQEALQEHLDESAEAFKHFSRLRRVDTLLRRAPFERAPQRLALNIMARLAKDLKMEHLTRTSGLALALALALLTAVLLPLLVLISWGLLALIGSAGALASALHGLVRVLVIARGLFELLIEQAQSFVSTYPQVQLLSLLLVPVSAGWYWLLRLTRKVQSPLP